MIPMLIVILHLVPKTQVENNNNSNNLKYIYQHNFFS